MRRLQVDFNSVRDGLAVGLRESLSDWERVAEVGEPILLYDGEHEMTGTIASIEDLLVRVAVDWDTWTTPATGLLDALTLAIDAATKELDHGLDTVPTEGSSAADSPVRELELA